MKEAETQEKGRRKKKKEEERRRRKKKKEEERRRKKKKKEEERRRRRRKKKEEEERRKKKKKEERRKKKKEEERRRRRRRRRRKKKKEEEEEEAAAAAAGPRIPLLREFIPSKYQLKEEGTAATDKEVDGKNMKKWDGEPTSKLEARVRELKRKETNKKFVYVVDADFLEKQLRSPRHKKTEVCFCDDKKASGGAKRKSDSECSDKDQ
ncbi:hypothetical protein BTVI_114286 [Pitangus sulphuratus]|nr:hypothetical protein BTVI_114286 [Pitangus sulphuratus]